MKHTIGAIKMIQMIQMRRTIAALAAAIALASCASTYTERSPQWAEWLGGYGVTQIDDHTLRINARGNDYTGLNQVAWFIMRAAAERARSMGFEAFEITEAVNTSGLDVVPGFAAVTYTRGTFLAFAFPPSANVVPGIVATITLTHDTGRKPGRFLADQIFFAEGRP